MTDATSRRVVEEMTDLERRWNRAACEVGICGSEYHNDPEMVFKRVREIQRKYRAAMLELHRRSNRLGRSA